MSTFPIAIIGAGPAGIATAIEAINRGYKAEEIVIIEKSGNVAHMIYTKYPDEKPVIANYKGRLAACLGDMCIKDMTKKEFFDYLDEVVKKYKLNINFHQGVQKITKLRNGQFNLETDHDTYTCNVIFVAIGNMAAPRSLGVPVDPEVNSKIYYDLQKITLEQNKVLVVGGGDSAGEYAKILHDRGHKVSLSYRGTDFTRMIEKNAMQTKELVDSKKLEYFPGSVVEKIGHNNGRAVVSFKDKKFTESEFDAVVVALGTERPMNYLNSIGINTEMESGDHFSESQMGGLFFVGDLASGKGGGSINFAFNSGVKAVHQACDMYLDCRIPLPKKAAS